MNSSPEILILGAGISGIAAARTAKAAGKSVLLLEARHRIGGRVHTVDCQGTPVDLGASWIHGGSRRNPLTDIAAEFGAETAKTRMEEVRVWDFDGRELSEKELRQVDRLGTRATRALLRASEDADANGSLENAVETLIAAMAFPSATVKRAVEDLIAAQYELDRGEDAARLGFAGFDADGSFPGGDMLLLKGYGPLLEALAQGLDVRFGEVVEHITHGLHGATVRTNRGEFHAPKLIVTLPLGVLKSGRITFQPQLPPAKQAAMGRLAMGTLNKIVLRFHQAFWPTGTHGMVRLQSSRATNSIFLPLTPTHGAPVVVWFAKGEHSRRLESESDAAVEAFVMNELRVIFGQDIPAPVAMIRTRWQADPFAEGSYSVRPPGASWEDFEAIAEPVGEVLFFAGEATHRKYSGTMHGAWLSGVRAGNSVS